MSLLLEALKKAEKAKRANVTDKPMDSSETESGASQDLTLELPALQPDKLQLDSREAPGSGTALPELHLGGTETSAPSHEQAFPEISLAEMEAPEPAPAPLETLNTPPVEAAPPPAEQPLLDFAPPDFPQAAAEAPRDMLTIALKSEEGALPAPPVAEPERPVEPVLTLDFPEPPAPRTPMASELPAPATTTAAPPPVAMPPHTDAAPAAAQPMPAAEPAATPPPAKTDTAADTAKMQEAAKKLLAAKQDKPKRNFKLLGAILAVSMLTGAALAYYYWQALSQPSTSLLIPQRAPQPPVPPAAPAPAPQPVLAQPAEAPGAAQESAGNARGNEEPLTGMRSTAQKPPQPAAAAAEKPVTRKKPAVAAADESAPAEPAPVKKTAGTSSEPDKAAIRSAAPVSAPESGIKFRRDTGETKLDPLLASAYQAFMAGDTGRAENDYRKALQQTPNNRDALLGLAAVAAKRGQAQEAATHYLRVLQLDPRDAAAQAGLIGLRGYADPTMSESRLKTLLAQQPDAGYLHFALGNLYAYQARWPEAQEAYFNALHGDAGNADYAFNLAVSLDHLDQRKPALVYYQRALTLVKERSASFDSEQLKKRIHELQGN